MLYSYRWVQQFLNKIPPVEDIASRLTVSGLEVESLKRTYTDIDGVIAARVQDVRPHPDAGDLHVVDVFTGTRTLTTVTAAAGIKPGTVVAYAPAGASVSGGRTIADVDIKGQRSYGMIVSEYELGIPGPLSE
ncbi:MAG: phenylalanine--tRNA ligase subunit beta, partial [Deltaproteobacteria bacterium]|nr:phenylalanine--tRNA ligase subunit beta [Deltaproteobacteria bacterium]